MTAKNISVTYRISKDMHSHILQTWMQNYTVQQPARFLHVVDVDAESSWVLVNTSATTYLADAPNTTFLAFLGTVEALEAGLQDMWLEEVNGVPIVNVLCGDRAFWEVTELYHLKEFNNEAYCDQRASEDFPSTAVLADPGIPF